MTAPFHRATVSIRGVIAMPEAGLLVLKRATDGKWEIPGGRLEENEAVIDGLQREIDEETGLSVEVQGPVHTTAWRNERDEGRFAAHYHCTTAHDDVTLSGEHVDAEWVTPADATRRLKSAQATAVRRACQHLGFDIPVPRTDARSTQSHTVAHPDD